MNKQYENSVSTQIFQLAKQGKDQIIRSFDLEKLQKAIPKDIVKKSAELS